MLLRRVPRWTCPAWASLREDVSTRWALSTNSSRVLRPSPTSTRSIRTRLVHTQTPITVPSCLIALQAKCFILKTCLFPVLRKSFKKRRPGKKQSLKMKHFARRAIKQEGTVIGVWVCAKRVLIDLVDVGDGLRTLEEFVLNAHRVLTSSRKLAQAGHVHLGTLLKSIHCVL